MPDDEPKDPMELKQRVLILKYRRRLPFLLALYQTIDELTAKARTNENPPLACCAGCDYCCHQVVTCTLMEWRVIREHLLSDPRSVAIARLRERAAQWRRLYAEFGGNLPTNPGEIPGILGKQACVFLDDTGKCAVYPVRPLACRVHVSAVRCDEHEGRRAQNFRYLWELWANNWQLEQDAKTNGTGKFGVTPLPHWLCVSRY